MACDCTELVENLVVIGGGGLNCGDFWRVAGLRNPRASGLCSLPGANLRTRRTPPAQRSPDGGTELELEKGPHGPWAMGHGRFVVDRHPANVEIVRSGQELLPHI